ncbi:glycerol dehydrogenase, partial [Enterobacter quasiroggenkampii]|nr:glycerol dehydrogenase [Enterobacter quasiroggenkampii]
CVSIGLPVCLADLGVTSVTNEELQAVAQKACIPEESIHSMPFPVTEEMVVSAIRVADMMGQQFKDQKDV